MNSILDSLLKDSKVVASFHVCGINPSCLRAPLINKDDAGLFPATAKVDEVPKPDLHPERYVSMTISTYATVCGGPGGRADRCIYTKLFKMHELMFIRYDEVNTTSWLKMQ